MNGPLLFGVLVLGWLLLSVPTALLVARTIADDSENARFTRDTQRLP